MPTEIAAQLQEYADAFIRFLPSLIASIVTFVAALILSALGARWVRRAARERSDNDELALLLSRLARWSVIIVGLIVALEQIDFDVTSFVAGLGILGFTIGFALQDIARNFVAGILLLIRRPFEIGDLVELAGEVGHVREISVRDTSIETRDGEHVILPNAEVLTNPIKNFSVAPKRRRTVSVGLGYGQDVEAASDAMLEAVRAVEGVADEPAASLLAEGLGDSALTLSVRFWVDQEAHSLARVQSDVVKAINRLAEQRGIDLPYPTQVVRLEQV
jgi:small-conductance mechanosensitive channel